MPGAAGTEGWPGEGGGETVGESAGDGCPEAWMVGGVGELAGAGGAGEGVDAERSLTFSDPPEAGGEDGVVGGLEVSLAG